MNNIEMMMEAIRQAITVMEIDTPSSYVLDLCYKSLSEGEAELRREPDATIAQNEYGYGYLSSEWSAPYIPNVGDKLYTR